MIPATSAAIIMSSSVVSVTVIMPVISISVNSAGGTFATYPFTLESIPVEPAITEEITVISFKVRTVMFIIETIPVVTIPDRVIIISISGEIVLIDGSAAITLFTCRSNRSIDYRSGPGCDIDPRGREAEAHMRADIYL